PGQVGLGAGRQALGAKRGHGMGLFHGMSVRAKPLVHQTEKDGGQAVNRSAHNKETLTKLR
ncbi:MAG: hypothetical protein QMB32_01245, partial [Burkholderiaceae bacterium]